MKIKKTGFIFLISFLFVMLFCIRTSADTLLNVYLECQENTSEDAIRYIGTLENLTDLDEITQIRMNISISKDNEETKSAVKTTSTVYSSVSGTNGKEEAENTYYAVLTLTDLDSYKGYRLSVYFTCVLSDGTTLDTNTVNYDIENKISVTYHLNGGSITDSYGTLLQQFSVTYFDDAYWTAYATDIFLYDNETENKLGAKYARRIGLTSLSGNAYEVTSVYAPGTSDYGVFTDDYAIVVHTDNENYDALAEITTGSVIVLSDTPSVKGSAAVTAFVYDPSYVVKEYDADDLDATSLTAITSFTVTHFDVSNSQYNSYASSAIMLNDKTTENSLGALYSYRVSMNAYKDDSYLVENIYASGTSDYNKNTYDYTIVVHSNYSAGYSLVKKISVGDVIVMKDIPSSSGSCSIDVCVYDKDEYDAQGISLEPPVRSGYVFKGWYSSKDLSGDAVSSVSEDTDLYAKWEQASYDAYTLRTSDTDYIYGNDVSHYQGTITFSKYKANSGFMIAKVGQGTNLDEQFTTYVTNAIANDVPIGLYYYSTAASVSEAKEEASWVVTKLAALGYDNGTFTYPLFMDYEDSSIGISGMTKAENTAIINAFAQTLIDAGYYPGLYVGGSDWNNYINQEGVICDVWVARYPGNSTIAASVSTVISGNCSSKKVTMIQFDDGEYCKESKSGATLGASSTYVDQDVCFVDYPTIIKERHFNGF